MKYQKKRNLKSYISVNKATYSQTLITNNHQIKEMTSTVRESKEMKLLSLSILVCRYFLCRPLTSEITLKRRISYINKRYCI